MNGNRLRSILVRAASLAGGWRLAHALDDMRRAQWLTIDEQNSRMEARLVPLLSHALVNVPFYREHAQRLGLRPNEGAAIEFLKRLPVIKKSDFRGRPERDFFAANLPPYRRLPSSTSGSTGEPFKFHLDREQLPVVHASHLYYDECADLGPLDRYIRIMGPRADQTKLEDATPLAASARYLLREQLQRWYEERTQRRISVLAMDDRTVSSIYELMGAFRPSFVLGYTSSLSLLATELAKRNAAVPSAVRGVITIAESLTPDRRRAIESYFRCPIINRYGQREFGFWAAQSCPASPESFHLNTELVVPEIVDETGAPVQPGAIGRLVLTNLHNRVMPLIRYDTGDLASFAVERCACGLGFPLMANLVGRSLECFRIPSGGIVGPTTLGQHLFVANDYTDAVLSYQLIQESDTNGNLLVVPAAGWTDQTSTRLRADLGNLLGPDVDIRITKVAQIPLDVSGKRPIIKRAMRSVADAQL